MGDQGTSFSIDKGDDDAYTRRRTSRKVMKIEMIGKRKLKLNSDLLVTVTDERKGKERRMNHNCVLERSNKTGNNNGLRRKIIVFIVQK